MNEAAAEPIVIAEPRAPVIAQRPTRLIPADTVAGRALIVVIAIMTFLACITAGAAIIAGEAAQAWRGDISQSATIEVRPKAGEDAEALLAKVADAARAAPGVAEAHALTMQQTESLLAPWLGRGLDLSRLPIPRLVAVKMNSGAETDLGPLRAALAAVTAQASLDDHGAWLKRLTAVSNVIVTFAIAVFLLVIVAMATAIGFATRGAVANAREIVEVLHFVGASDGFIAAQFQQHFLRLGSRGAIAGGGAAALTFLVGGLASWWWTNSPGGSEIAALFGAFSLHALGYAALVAIGFGVTMLTGYLSRRIVLQHLRGFR